MSRTPATSKPATKGNGEAKKTARKKTNAPLVEVAMVPADSPLSDAIGQALTALPALPAIPSNSITDAEAVFCAEMATGRTDPARAYAIAGLGAETLTRPQMSVLGYLLLERADIAAYIRRCRRDYLKAAEYSADDLKQWLIDAIHTPADELSERSEIVQEASVGAEGAMKLKSVPKVECARLLSDLCGFKQASKLEVTVAGGVTIETLQERAAQLGRAMSSAKLVRASEIVEAEVIEPIEPDPTDDELLAMAAEAVHSEPVPEPPPQPNRRGRSPLTSAPRW